MTGEYPKSWREGGWLVTDYGPPAPNEVTIPESRLDYQWVGDDPSNPDNQGNQSNEGDTSMTTVTKPKRPRAPRIQLTTTPEIIDRALPKDSGHCVYADAVKAAVPNAQFISVDLQTIRFTDPDRGCRYTYLTPRSVQVDLVNFDQGIKPQPMTVGLRGGQVTKANRRTTQSATPKKVAGQIPERTTLVGRPDGRNVPARVGGKTPPLAAYGHTGGRRREFGLRGLGRPVQAEPGT